MSAMTTNPPNNQVIAFSPELWTTVLLRRDMVSPGRLYAQTLLTPPRRNITQSNFCGSILLQLRLRCVTNATTSR
jgi:hypothetical protein